MKTNNIWANKFKPTNQFYQYNELRKQKQKVDDLFVMALGGLLFLAGFVSCYIFMGG